MKIFLASLAALLLVSCAHLPVKSGAETGLIILPVVAGNPTGVDYVYDTGLWFSDLAPYQPWTVGTKSNGEKVQFPQYGIAVPLTGANLVLARKQPISITHVIQVANPRYTTNYRAYPYAILQPLPFAAGRVSVAPFKMVLTQKLEGDSYWVRWRFDPLSEQEREAILKQYRDDKENAAWFE